MANDLEPISKLFAFLTSLNLNEAVGVAAGLLGPAGTAGYFLYKHGKAAAAAETAAQRAEISLLRTDNATKGNELDRIRPAHDRLNERVHELTQENLALRGAFGERPDGGQNKALIEQLQLRVDKFDQLKNALLGAEDEVWKLRAAAPPTDFERRMVASRIKILTVGNLKGGVGKTTLTANLAAYFAIARQKRVLVIDFDYQGSLTRMLLSGAQVPLGGGILADTLLGGDVRPIWLVQASRELGARVRNTRLITCGPTFDGFENRALLRWLIGEIAEDIRFRLASLLLSDDVQNQFDIVLIDAPPRLSLGTVNALVASHGLIVPTVPDALSVDATNRFVTRANLFRGLNPALREIGIVTSMSVVSRLKDYETAAMSDARQGLSQWNGASGMILTRNIRHFRSLSRSAGKTIGYISDAAVRSVFNELGEEIAAAWQL